MDTTLFLCLKFNHRHCISIIVQMKRKSYLSDNIMKYSGRFENNADTKIDFNHTPVLIIIMGLL
jgi:hypothetical protein